MGVEDLTHCTSTGSMQKVRAPVLKFREGSHPNTFAKMPELRQATEYLAHKVFPDIAKRSIFTPLLINQLRNYCYLYGKDLAMAKYF